MANIPLQLYKKKAGNTYKSGAQYDWDLLPATNTPFGWETATADEFKQFAKEDQQTKLNQRAGTFGYSDIGSAIGKASGRVDEYTTPWGEKLTNVSQETINKFQSGQGGMSPTEFKAQQQQQPTGQASSGNTGNWTSYYQAVLNNPTATETARQEARQKLGLVNNITTTSSNGLNSPNMPSANFDTSGAGAYIKSSEAQDNVWMQMAQQAMQQQQQAMQQQTANQSRLDKILGSFQNLGQQRDQALQSVWGQSQQQYFADRAAKRAEIETLQNDYNATVAQRDKQIADQMGGMASMNFINNQVAQINRNANVILGQKSANINTKLAVMQMQNGDYQEAMKSANQAVNDWVKAKEIEYDMAKTFYNENADLIKSLGKDVKDAFIQYQSQKNQEITWQRQDARNKIEDAFKREGLDLQWAEFADKNGSRTGPIGTSRFDNGLQMLMTENPNLSAGQLADLYINNSSENLTKDEKTELFNRARVVASKSNSTMQPSMPTNNLDLKISTPEQAKAIQSNMATAGLIKSKEQQTQDALLKNINIDWENSIYAELFNKKK